LIWRHPRNGAMADESNKIWQRILWVLLVSVVASGCGRQPPPLPTDQLQIKINLLCTTCDDFLQCSASGQSIESGFKLYRLREKSLFAQIATIWDYLVQWVRRKTADNRPLTVYMEEDGARRIVLEAAEARVDMVSGLITLPDSTIDMRNGSWIVAGEAAGQCRTMVRRDGYLWVRSLLNKPLPAGVQP